MRKISVSILLLVSALCLLSGAFGSGIVYSPAKIPFEYDPNQIVGEKLGGVSIEATDFLIVDVNSSHSKNFPFVITIASAPPGVYIVNDANDWRLQWTTDVNDVGTHYIVIEALDMPPPPWKSKTMQGTIVIQVVELNPGPVLHEFKDSPVATNVWPNDHKRYWQRLAKQRTIIKGPVVMDL